MRYFRTAWSPVLIASAVTLPLLFAAIIAAAVVFRFWILAIVPFAVLAGTLPFAIRGYSVADGSLVIHHPFSRTRFVLSPYDPEGFLVALNQPGKDQKVEATE